VAIHSAGAQEPADLINDRVSRKSKLKLPTLLEVIPRGLREDLGEETELKVPTRAIIRE